MPRPGKAFKKYGKSHINNIMRRKGIEVRVRPADENISLSPSASKIKLGPSIVPGDAKQDRNTGFRILDLELLAEALRKACKCSVCGGNVNLVDDGKREGLVCTLHILCENCDTDISFKTSKTSNRMYEANMRFAYGLRCVGLGREGGNLLCGMMNMPSPPLKFTAMNTSLFSAVADVSEESMKMAVQEAVQENCDATNSTDISISCDSSWMKRGHTSLHGVSTVISVDTGKVLDLQVMSKYCSACSLHKKYDDASKETAWQEEHKAVCSKNYLGSSGGMEPAGMKLIFHRSLQKYGVRYIKYLGDGDSSAFKSVVESQPYGKDCSIEKLECLGHIQKRMGGRLRRLVADSKGKLLEDGKPLGGKNRLTKKRIDSLQVYYGGAIRNNLTDLDNMRKAVWAIWFHYLSTDDSPQHGLCSSQWCKFLKSKDSGEPYSHKNNLPYEVAMAIKPTFRALASPELLEKCLHGKTQNPNESFNALIWKRCPKTVFVSNLVVNISALEAAAVFNDGNIARLHILRKLGFTPGVFTEQILRAIDEQRIAKAETSVQNIEKIARQRNREAKRAAEDDDEQEEYGYGQF